MAYLWAANSLYKTFGMKKILLIEDDPALAQNIKEALEDEMFHIDLVFDGFLGERSLKKNQYDCVVLDVNLPGQNGYELCKLFRTYNQHTPVLMLTAFGDLDDKIQGFDSGADDYLTKPFYMKELLLRIHALLKRVQNSGKEDNNPRVVVAADIVIQLQSKKVTRQGKEIVLTPREFQILLKLVEQPGELVSKKDLIKEVWGDAIDVNTNIIEVYINFLRNKIDKPFQKTSIKTKIGYGYYFESN